MKDHDDSEARSQKSEEKQRHKVTLSLRLCNTVYYGMYVLSPCVAMFRGSPAVNLQLILVEPNVVDDEVLILMYGSRDVARECA